MYDVPCFLSEGDVLRAIENRNAWNDSVAVIDNEPLVRMEHVATRFRSCAPVASS